MTVTVRLLVQDTWQLHLVSFATLAQTMYILTYLEKFCKNGIPSSRPQGKRDYTDVSLYLQLRYTIAYYMYMYVREQEIPHRANPTGG